MRPQDTGGTLLQVRGLEKSFPVRRTMMQRLRREQRLLHVAVDGVDLDVAHGEALGVVGESGSGKTTLARCLIRLVEPDAGQVVFAGEDVTSADSSGLRSLRRRMQMIFQDPYTSLNPRMEIGDAIAEPAIVHNLVDHERKTQRVAELLDLVGLSPNLASRRPKQLSGGQRQRVAIARALAAQPDLLIADEAVSSLDVSIQAQILELFRELRAELDLTLVFVAHQLSVVAQVADRVAVMYLGEIVEQGPTASIFSEPQHPYTKALLAAHPRPDPNARRPGVLPGDAPSPTQLPSGCRFRSRCAFAEDVCAEERPVLEPVTVGWSVACHIRPFGIRPTARELE